MCLPTTVSPFGRDLTVHIIGPSQEIKFRHVFLTAFKSFTTADMVFDKLVGWFRTAPPIYLSEDELEEWREKKQRSTQQRVLTLFTMWLEDHNMIKEDPHIVHRLQGFLQSIVDPHPLAIPAKLIIEAIGRLVGVKVHLEFISDIVTEPRPSCPPHTHHARTYPETTEESEVPRH